MIKKETYTISFYVDSPNWVSFSNIDKNTFYSFIEYLYSLKRKIIALPYISGGWTVRPVPDQDNTYKVLNIVKDINNKIPIHQMLAHYFSSKNMTKGKFFNIHFNEDILEFLLSLGLNKNDALQIADDYCRYIPNVYEVEYRLLNMKNINRSKAKAFIKWLETTPRIQNSRWMFIYMFRNEFRNFMNEKGYKVHPIGGWILNNKEREIRLGLIDEDGELF